MTDDEKRIVAARAAGSYAVLPRCREIFTRHRKGNGIYVEFLRVVFAPRFDREQYEQLQRAILAEWDDPFAGTRKKEAPRAKPVREPTWQGNLRAALTAFNNRPRDSDPAPEPDGAPAGERESAAGSGGDPRPSGSDGASGSERCA